MPAKTDAFAYLRVSSRGQTDGDGFDRQRDTIQRFARRAGLRILREFQDAHTGTEADRPALTDLLATVLANGVRTVVVESLDRFARDVVVQGVLLARLREHGVALLVANTGDDVTAAIADDPMREAMIQVQAVFSQVEKKRLVAKLAHARQAKRDATGRCEGRKPYGERPGEAAVAERIRQLHRKPRGGRRLSFKAIADRLNAESVPTRYGEPWRPSTVGSIVKRFQRR